MAAKKDRPPQLQKLFDRLPPHSPEAEMALLGSLILDVKQIHLCRPLVEESDFYSVANAIVYDSINMVERELGSLDLVTLHEMLRDRSELETVGGASYLQTLAECVPSAVNSVHYAKIVADKARLRNVITACGDAIHRAYHLDGGDADEACSRAVAEVSQAATPKNAAEDIPLHEADQSVFDALDKQDSALLSTGIEAWDKEFGGWPVGGVVVPLGWPSSGKTTLALGVAEHMAATHNSVVRVFSYEQPSRRVAATILSARTGISVHRYINRGQLPGAEEWTRLRAAKAVHAGLSFRIVEQNLNAEAIYARMAAVRSQFPKRHLLVIVDYLQHLPWPEGIKDERVAITNNMNRLADIARRLDATVVIVCQPTQAAVKEDRCPRMGDANGAQAISARTDMAFAVYRPHQQEQLQIDDGMTPFQKQGAIEDWKERQAVTQLTMLKNKYEKMGAVAVRFNGAAMRFEYLPQP